MSQQGPIYGVTLIESLPINGGMLQAMPTRGDLISTSHVSTRTAAGYEILLGHYQEVVAERDRLKTRVVELEETIVRMNEDAEVGKLVRGLLEKHPSPQVITIARKAHDCYAVTAPSIRYASFIGKTLKQALAQEGGGK